MRIEQIASVLSIPLLGKEGPGVVGMMVLKPYSPTVLSVCEGPPLGKGREGSQGLLPHLGEGLLHQRKSA